MILINGKNKLPEELNLLQISLYWIKSLDDKLGTNITSMNNEQNSSKLDINNNKSKLLNNSNQSDKNMSNNAFEQTNPALICGKYKPQTLVELREAKAVKQWKLCKILSDISLVARLLLCYHNKLDHIDFDKLKGLTSAGYLPSKITKAEKVGCAAYQIGKAHLKPAAKGSIVIKDETKDPGDAVHMDQTESSTSRRLLT